MIKHIWVSILMLALISGCSSKSGGRYSIKNDHGPASPVDVSHVPDAVPKVEPRSRGGNKSPYVVLGKTYYVMKDANGYREEGGASWYGKKFHGHLTSNGEVYDMYEMTAAHKSLPIPSYVKVTNLANNRQVIVRVNDRGPFHKGRIIDLSYAAASKLGMLSHGTARVRVEAINPRSWQSSQSVRALGKSTMVNQGRYLQVGAYSARASAERVAQEVERLTGAKARIGETQSSGRVLYRVLLVADASEAKVEKWVGLLAQNGYPGAHRVDFP